MFDLYSIKNCPFCNANLMRYDKRIIICLNDLMVNEHEFIIEDNKASYFNDSYNFFIDVDKGMFMSYANNKTQSFKIGDIDDINSNDMYVLYERAISKLKYLEKLL